MFNYITAAMKLARIQEKNAEFTLGVHAGSLAELVPDNQASIFTQEHSEQVIFELEKALMGSVRSLNEKYELLRQAIMYSFIWRMDPVKGIQFFIYRRTKRNTEGQLAHRLSLGAGGHFEIFDLLMHDGKGESDVAPVIDFGATCIENYGRERDEEIDGDDREVSPYAEPTLHGFVMDSKPTPGYVGNIHFGMLAGVEVISPNHDLQMKEAHNTAEGWFTPEELTKIVTNGGKAVSTEHGDDLVNFEPWSVLMIEKIGVLVATLKSAA